MKNYKEYREGNPVIVNNCYTHIKALPSSSNNYYYVLNDGRPHSLNELSPIPINETVYSTYKHLIENGRWVFSVGEAKVELDIPSNSCHINGNHFGQIEFLHELKNLLEDEIQFHMTYYSPVEE